MAKYRAEMCSRVLEMMRTGASHCEVAAELRISRETLYVWRGRHAQFARALADGLQLSQAWWEKLGRAGASGKIDIQPAVWIFNMKNRFGWVDREAALQTHNVNIKRTIIELSDAELAAIIAGGGDRDADSPECPPESESLH